MFSMYGVKRRINTTPELNPKSERVHGLDDFKFRGKNCQLRGQGAAYFEAVDLSKISE